MKIGRRVFVHLMTRTCVHTREGSVRSRLRENGHAYNLVYSGVVVSVKDCTVVPVCAIFHEHHHDAATAENLIKSILPAQAGCEAWEACTATRKEDFQQEGGRLDV